MAAHWPVVWRAISRRSGGDWGLFPRLETLTAHLPAEMLAAVERDHLAGHGWRIQDEQDGARDLARTGAVAERHGGRLLGELLLGLARRGQRGTGTDAVHP